MSDGNQRSTKSGIFAYNCAPCKKRKTRCDRVKPCSNCTLRNCQSDCYPPSQEESTFSRQDHKGNRRSQSPVPRQQPPLPIKTDVRPSPRRDIPHAQPGTITQSTMALALPAPALCFALIDYAESVSCSSRFFFPDSQLTYYVSQMLAEASFLDIESLKKTVTSIMSDEYPLPRQACLLFWTLAFAAQNIPSGHSLAQTYLHLGKSTEHWRHLAVQLYPSVQASDEVSDVLLDVFIHTLQSMWHSKYGEVTQGWHATGIAIRQAAVIRLFDPIYPVDYSSLTGDRLRGFLVAHRLLLMDRWMTFNNQCPMGIGREDLDVVGGPFAINATTTTTVTNGTIIHSSLAESYSLRVSLEQKQVILLELGRRLRRSRQYNLCSKESLRLDAQSFLSEIDFHRCRGEESMTGMSLLLSNDLSQFPIEKAFRIAEWRGAFAYIACVSTMAFIHDQEASLSLRQASIQSACEVLKAAPIYIKALQSNLVPVYMPRLSNQLFCAFRAVIVTKVNEDLLGSEGASLLGNRNLTTALASTPASHSLNRGNSTTGSTHDAIVEAPDERMLYTLMQNGMACIEEMQKLGSPIAKRVMHLVQGAVQRHPKSLDFAIMGEYREVGSHTSLFGETTVEEGNAFQMSTAFDKLVEAFLGGSSTPAPIDQVAQLQQMDDILASFLEGVPQTSGVLGSVW